MAETWYRIHPAIGVARVGNALRNAQDFYFMGPEIPAVPAYKKYDSLKTGGRIKPQAARFRIFEYKRNDDGSVKIREVNLNTVPTAKITWRVHLANRKANFCQFNGQQGALDTNLKGEPFFFSSYSADHVRNPTVKGLNNRRTRLELDPAERPIVAGGPTKIVQLTLNHPGLQNIKTLGELRTDADGALIVIGGMGLAERFVKNAPLDKFANNNGWFDDISDGPIEATIDIGNDRYEAESAWLLVGPPDFAPAVRSYRTMYDTLVDMIVREPKIQILKDDVLFNTDLSDIREMKEKWKPGVGLQNFRPSFKDHIEPILRSMHRIMRIHAQGAGQKVEYHAKLDPQFYDDLRSAGSRNRRSEIFFRIRDPKTLLLGQKTLTPAQRTKIDPKKVLMPFTFGDFSDVLHAGGYDRGDDTDPAFFHSVSELQYELLRLWEAGDFDDEWKDKLIDPNALSPAGLDRAALEDAIGGAFFPGIEASWLFTKPEAYRAPFRIDYRANEQDRTVLGQIPVPDDAHPNLTRPLRIEAGTFSQQMALPWQADFYECTRNDKTIGQPSNQVSVRIAWWPAKRPDDVFPAKAPHARVAWARDKNGKPFSDHEKMANNWWRLGFIVEKEDHELYEVDGP